MTALPTVDVQGAADLERFYRGRAVTLGTLRHPDIPALLYTCEDAWQNNAPHVSCIPDGLYAARPRLYHKGGYDAWEITGVPGRSLILFHMGNKAEDVEGCIVTGREIGCFGGQPGVARSREAHALLLERWRGKSFLVHVHSRAPLEPALVRLPAGSPAPPSGAG